MDKRNGAFVKWMEEADLSAREVAELVNQAVGELTGRVGGLEGSNIRDWRSGRVGCPKGAQLRAIELVSGRSALELGFRRRSRATPRKPEEPPVDRRDFSLGTAVIAAATVIGGASPAAGAARRVGMSDVARVRQSFDEIIASDHRHGGQLGIEKASERLADEALALQGTGTASQRVRGALYGAAAAFRSSAMWAAIDGRRFDAAEEHLRKAAEVASMSGDQAIQFRIWSHAGTMYRHMGKPGEADAANQVARRLGIVRRDPVFASLGLARHGAIHATAGDHRAARRAFQQAEEAWHRSKRSDDAGRPSWLVAFYDEAEINSLAMSAYLSLGMWADAEAHGHRCLASLRGHMHRSRAIATARLARAQLEQGEVEAAVTTAMRVPEDSAANHPRVVGMLTGFGTRLSGIASNSSHAAMWWEHAREIKENRE
ncbi:XRE family transcriptional regulator [Streptomyces sp. NPDC020472]|uniref:XRE family transcriptional regulator n=1 Tax=Streptomyces sp. NPDC020472 TaxID=3365075 RepID=UPI0037B9C961